MKAQYIDYDETRCFTSIVSKLLSHESSLKPFVNQFPSLASFKSIISERNFKGNRVELVKVLHQQYQDIHTSEAVKQNINLLKEGHTFTITTGHQLNIFTGPFYFIFKIVSAINLAKDLKNQFPDKDFVPVYWMATEDHDFEEINHTHIGGKKISWKLDAVGATGRLNTKSIIQAVNEYKGILGISANAEKLANLITKAYTENQTLTAATRFLVNELFGEYGLIILDADDKMLKTQFSSIIEKDILEENSFRNITKSNEELAKIDIQAQVNPREINFFYLTDDLRERIIFEEERYQILNSEISFSEEELKAEIKNHPERFSPNVVMRPLYQEVILPNLAYIGGGGELAYWLQLKSNFDYYQVDFPLLILRNSALLADEKTEAKLHKLNLAFADAFEETEALKKLYVSQHSKHELNIKEEWDALKLVFDGLKIRAKKIDPTLAPSTEAVQTRLKKALDNLEKKLIRAEKRNFSEAMNDIEKIKTQLFPSGGLQERKENFGLFYVKYGDDLIPELIKHFKPLDFKFTILH